MAVLSLLSKVLSIVVQWYRITSIDVITFKIYVSKNNFFSIPSKTQKTSPYRCSSEDFETIFTCIPKDCIAFVCGDLNFPNSTWANWTSTDSEEISVLELFKNRLFRHSIDFPTCSKNLMSCSTKTATRFQQMQMISRKFSTVLTTLGSEAQSNYHI